MRFYQYEYFIKEEFERQGNVVDLIYDTKSYKRKYISQKKYEKKNFNYQKVLLEQLKKNKYDKVLVLVGRFLTTFFLSELKKRNKSAQFLLYLWDDIARVQNFHAVRKYYDYIYSFDKEDCKKYDFKFLPLFFINAFDLYRNNYRKDIDIYGAFSNHSDRLKVLQRLDSNNNTNSFFFVTVSCLVYLKQKIHKTFSTKFHFSVKPLSVEENIEYMKRSIAIIDIQHPSQKGLTLRTLEALGCGNKIITTNDSIYTYDFFDKTNICVINRENPIIPEDFFSTPYKKLDDTVYKKYTLENWCKIILRNHY